MTQTKAELLQTRHQGDIRLGDADSTHYVGFKAPATVGTSLVWTLPAADGTANYLLKTDGSGNLGWVADSSTDSTKMPLAGGTFTGDVTFDGATAGRDIVFDRSDNALEFADNAKATFGSTLSIDTNGTNNNIKGLSGHLNIHIADNSSFSVGNSDFSENILLATQGAGVNLYHSANVRLSTSSTGISITGGLDIGDGVHNTSRIAIGDSDDLCLYHNGSNSFLVDRGTGPLYVRGNAAVRIEKYVDDSNGEPMIIANVDGAVELYHDNVKKFETTAQAVKFTGGIAQVVTAAGALELDLNTSNYFTKTISGNSTFTFANPAASGQVTAFTLELTHSSGTVTWPSSVKWNADTAPTLTTGKTHLFMFVTDDGGTRYRGSALVDYVN
jgi:hypothetical protein